MEIGRTSASKPPCTRSILVVDDEKASADLAAALLRSQGFEVEVVSSGHAALGRIAAGGVDLVLLDLMMAKLDGVEVCAHVREQLRDPFLPIIITTSLHDRQSRIRAKEAGADDVLLKPLDGLELFVRVDSLLRMRASALTLVRDRARMREELAECRARLTAQERAIGLAESVTEAMFAIVEEQWRQLEIARLRFPQQSKLQEQLQHLSALTVELRHYVECLAGTGTVTVLTANLEGSRDGESNQKTVSRLRK